MQAKNDLTNKIIIVTGCCYRRRFTKFVIKLLTYCRRILATLADAFVIDAQQTFTEIFSIREHVSVAKQFAAGRPVSRSFICEGFC